ncbi:MAG: TetR/AcrR family transcriptional regulator, partial [Gammaproteobacteria bacterium]|nr:TetR/AcrR family transcriptional regulator [Gammaproteobacteria bacterium]
MPPAETVSSSIPDGRRERTVSTRRRILDSTRGLILSGDFNPTASAIADHAGITRRTLFRHFPDMETLHREIILDAQRYAQAVMDEPFPSHLKEDLKEDLQEDFSTADR